MLAENVRKPRRDRLTRIRIFEELQALGYEGGYDAVRRYASSWTKTEREASAAACVPLSFDPGEANPVRLRGEEDQRKVRGTFRPTNRSS